MISVSEDWFWKVDRQDPFLEQTSSERGEDPDQDEVYLRKGSIFLGLVSVQSLSKVSDFDPDQPSEDRNKMKEVQTFFETYLILIRIFSSFRRGMFQVLTFQNEIGFFQNQTSRKETKIKSDQKRFRDKESRFFQGSRKWKK